MTASGSAAAASDTSAGARHPLTLRFRDPGVEREFQEEFGRRFRPQVIATFVGGMATWFGGAILLVALFPVDAIAIWIAIGFVEAVILSMLVALTRGATWGYEQALGGVVNLVSGLAITVVCGLIARQPQLLAPAFLLCMWFGLGLNRLGVVVGVGASVTYMAVFVAVVATGLIPGVSGLEIFLTLVGLVVGAATCYLLEASTRSIFWQRRIIAEQSRDLAEEKDRYERLLRNILPGPIADRLLQRPALVADAHPQLTVLFADLVGFTPLAARLTPAQTVEFLNELFSDFDTLATRHRLEKIKTMGDSYMAVAGAPAPVDGHARCAVAMGLDMLLVVAGHASERGLPLSLRVGVHTGPAVAGVIGTSRLSYDLWGDTVNVASRMESQGVDGAVQVSEATAGLLDGTYAVEPRGAIDVRGKGPMKTFLIRPSDDRLRIGANTS